MFFRGLFEHTIDAKGRTSVPARFREVLTGNYGDRLVVTTAFDRCLHVMPLKNWEALEARLGQRSSMEPGVKQIYRTYVANATEADVDKLGRILLPPNLRAWAELTKDVVWVGQIKQMELWSKAGWEKASADALSVDHEQDIARVFREIGG
ncbi:MAG TPA: division/cell wall cluster transcriptional repressor MraZ [Myxococcales bacterium]|jgi:MraZ protein|nr:division/cell wall cluster transcriptional repressor MraZ [Myxococcales bacterium]